MVIHHTIEIHSGRFKQNVCELLQQRKEGKNKRKNPTTKYNKDSLTLRTPKTSTQRLNDFNQMLKENPYQLSRILKLAKSQSSYSMQFSKRTERRQFKSNTQRSNFKTNLISDQQNVSYPLYHHNQYLNSLILKQSPFKQINDINLRESLSGDLPRYTKIPHGSSRPSLSKLTLNNLNSSRLPQLLHQTNQINLPDFSQADEYLDKHFKLESKQDIKFNIQQRIFIDKNQSLSNIKRTCCKRLYFNGKMRSTKQLSKLL